MIFRFLKIIFLIFFIFSCSKKGLDVHYVNLLLPPETSTFNNIDTTPPTIVSFDVVEGDGIYGVGQVLNFLITFSEIVNVDGVPTFTLETGVVDRVAVYISGSGTTELTFTYTVQTGDISSDLNYIVSSSFSGGTIADDAGNLIINFPTIIDPIAIAEVHAVLIDGIAPSIISFAVTEGDGTYGLGQSLNIVVTFDEVVFKTAIPNFTLETGATDRNAIYVSGDGTTELTFSYTAQAGDISADLNYITNASFAGGTIVDAAGNLIVNLPTTADPIAIAQVHNIIINTANPVISTVTSSTGNGNYTTGAVINIEINFSTDVNVTGTPQLTLNTGAVVNCTSQPTASSLRCPYTVLAGHNAADLNYALVTSFAANGATLEDAFFNLVDMTLPAVAGASSLGGLRNIRVDTTQPVADVGQTLTLQTYEASQDDITSSGTIILKYTDNLALASELTYTITTAGTKGIIYNTNTASTIALAGTFTQADIDNNYIEYRYNPSNTELVDTTGTDTDTVTISLSDGTTAAITGIAIAINIGHPCNDPDNAAVTNHLAIPKRSTPEFYFICRPEQFNSIGASATPATDWAYNFRLRKNISMTGIAGNHNIIGTIANPFIGTFDGNNNSITGWLHNAAADYIAPFGYLTGDLAINNISDGRIVNLKMINVSVTGNNYIGGLIAVGNSATIENVSVTGAITSSTNINTGCGGIVGSLNANSIIDSSFSNVTLLGGISVGGLVGITGSADPITITNSFSLGSISGRYTVAVYVGGLIGRSQNYSSVINDSFSMANVYGPGNYVGGLVGFSTATINRSFATGVVKGVSFTGGLCGTCRAPINHSYSTGNIFSTTGSHVGGFAGALYGTSSFINNSYATGNVTVTGAGTNIGGFVGHANTLNNSGYIQNSYSLGNVSASGSTNVGGLIGHFAGGAGTPNVTNSYARGNVIGGTSVGGLIGLAKTITSQTMSINKSYSTGVVVGTTNVGGFVGHSDISSDVAATINYSNVYYDSTNAVGVVDGEGLKTNTVTTFTTDSAGIIGQPTTWLQDKTNLSAVFDWQGSGTNVWVMPKNDDAANDTDRYPELTAHYKCFGNAWTDSPNYTGAGTKLDPYIICQHSQLNQAGAAGNSANWNKYYKMGESVDLVGYANYTNRFGIGTSFTGTFDGNSRNGVRINNFTATTNASNQGFFSSVNIGTPTSLPTNDDGGFIYDVYLKNLNITAGIGNVGGLVGSFSKGFIAHSGTTGTIIGSSLVGGLVGTASSGSLGTTKSFSSVNVQASGTQAGGLIGRSDSNIIESFAHGPVVATTGTAGGLVGLTLAVNIKNSFATGTTSGSDYIGGLIGFSINTSNHYNYSTSPLTINTGTLIGGVAGSHNGTGGNAFVNNYWDLTTSSTNSSYQGNGINVVNLAEGFVTATMKLQATFANWDFNSTWTTNGNTTYPKVLWSKYAAPTVLAVTSTSGNGPFTNGQTINILIIFSDDIDITGVPQITLDTGDVVTCNSQPTRRTLLCAYTVSVGDNDGDLGYPATTSLDMNGATAVDDHGNVLIATLPSPGTGQSLDGGNSIRVDNTQVVADAGQTLVLQAYEAGQNDITTAGTIVIHYNDNLAPDSQIRYTITTKPTKGTIWNTNTATELVNTSTFTQADLNSNYIEYRYNSTNTELVDTTGTDTDTMIFSVDDLATTALTGITLNINIAHPCLNPANAAVTGHKAIPKLQANEAGVAWYFLCRAPQLSALAASTGAGHLDQNYKMRQDINLVGEATPHDTIGTNGDPFSGTFDGNGHSVSNFNSSTAAAYIGFFGQVNGDKGSDNIGDGLITNVHMEKLVITGNLANTGGLVGHLAAGKITKASARGSISYTAAAGSVGGLVGVMNDDVNTIIDLSWADVDVTSTSASGSNLGGLVGSAGGTITNSFAVGNVTAGGSQAGGLVGTYISATGGDIDRCFATGNVRAFFGRVGGFIADLRQIGDLTNSYATGNAYTPSSEVGGFIGYASSTVGGTLSNLYAMGNVYGSSKVGGFMGVNGKRVNIRNFYSTGNVYATGVYAGGLIGQVDTPNGGAWVLSECFSTGDVTSVSDSVGGLVGYLNTAGNGSTFIRDCYSTGDVTGNDKVGGFIGSMDDTGAGGLVTVERSLSTGSITATAGAPTRVGGFIGDHISGNIGTGGPNYWDYQTSGLADNDDIGTGVGTYSDNAGIISEATADLQDRATYDATWLFKDDPGTIWTMRENNTDSIDYPRLLASYKCVDDAWTGVGAVVSDYINSGGVLDRDNPIVICRPEQWSKYVTILTDMDEAIIIGEDIDMSGENPGSAAHFNFRFTGVFDGQARLGFRLNNLNNELYTYGEGINGSIISEQGKVHDLRLSNYVSTSATDFQGSLFTLGQVGLFLSRITVDGTSIITNTGGAGACSTIGSLLGRTHNVTPIRYGTYVIQSQSNATINAANCDYVGGLIGASGAVYMKDSLFSGVINANSYVGGLIGSAANSQENTVITNSFVNASITGVTNVGGMIGVSFNSSTYNKSYVSGAIAGTAGVTQPGFVGLGGCGIASANSYWDVNITTRGSDNDINCTGQIGHTTAEMDNAANFINWDFNVIWSLTEDGATPPMLRWTQ